MNIKKLNLLIESMLKEYFDDDFQKNAHDYFDFNNPYNSQNLVKVSDLDSKALATTNNTEDNIADARNLFTKYVIPALEKLPSFFQKIKLHDNNADRILIYFPLKIKDMNIELYFSFRFDGKNVIVKVKPETFYNKIKLNPHQEIDLAANENIAGLREVGDYFRFTYKPFVKLSRDNHYVGLSKNTLGLANFLMKTVNSFLYLAREIPKNNLP